MKNCKRCNKELPDNAKQCIYCGYKPHNWILILVIISIFVFSAILGILFGDPNYTTSTTNSDVNESTSNIYYIGETIQFKNYSVTLNNIQTKEKGADIGDTGILDTEQVVAVTLTYNNTSNTDCSIANHTRLINGNGEKIKTSFFYYTIWGVNHMDFVTLISGGTKTGFLQYTNTIQDSIENMSLEISDGSLFGSTYIFKFCERPNNTN